MAKEFEEDFPSLKGDILVPYYLAVKQDNGGIINKGATPFPVLHVKDIQEKCLDKQKVKEAIEKLTHDCNKNHAIEWECDGMIESESLKKELGLVD